MTDTTTRATFIGRLAEWGLPATAFIVAVAIRLYFLFSYRYPLMIHEQDAAGYIAVAKNILSFSPFFDSFRPPGYPAVIALLSPFAPDIETAARYASIFMDALVVFPLYYSARIFLSRVAATAATALWAFFSFALYFSPSPLSQSTYLFFLACGIVVLHRALAGAGNRSLAVVSGTLFGAAYLTRPEGIVGLVCAVLFSLARMMPRNDGLKRGCRYPLFIVAGFLLVTGPYLVFLRQALGYWGFTGKSDAAVKTLDAIYTLDESGNLPTAKRGIDVWREYYGSLDNFLKEVLRNLEQFIQVYLRTFPLWVHLIGLAGFVYLAVQGQWLIAYLLILLAVTAPNYIVNIPKTHSYIYSVFPLLFISFAGAGEMTGGTVAAALKRRWPSAPAAIAEIAIGVILAPVVVLISYLSVHDAHATFSDRQLVEQAMLSRNIYAESAAFIRERSAPKDLVMTRWGLIGYFAGRNTVTLPKGGVPEVLAYGRKNGVRFVVIDTVSVVSRRQELVELLNPLKGAPVDPALGIVPLGMNYHEGLGGWIVYAYR